MGTDRPWRLLLMLLLVSSSVCARRRDPQVVEASEMVKAACERFGRLCGAEKAEIADCTELARTGLTPPEQEEFSRCESRSADCDAIRRCLVQIVYRSKGQ